MTHTISLGKRLLAAMLAVLLALSILPLPAFAADDDGADETGNGHHRGHRHQGRHAEIPLELNGNTLQEVFLDDAALGQSAYSLTGETLTISTEAVNAAGVGTHTLRLTFDPLGETYVEKTGNEAPAERTCCLVIEKSPPR